MGLEGSNPFVLKGRELRFLFIPAGGATLQPAGIGGSALTGEGAGEVPYVLAKPDVLRKETGVSLAVQVLPVLFAQSGGLVHKSIPRPLSYSLRCRF